MIRADSVTGSISNTKNKKVDEYKIHQSIDIDVNLLTIAHFMTVLKAKIPHFMFVIIVSYCIHVL